MATGTRLHRKSMAAREADNELRKKYAAPDAVVEPLGEVKRQRKVAVYKPRKHRSGEQV